MLSVVTRTPAEQKQEKNQSGRRRGEQWSVAITCKYIHFWGLFCFFLSIAPVVTFICTKAGDLIQNASKMDRWISLKFNWLGFILWRLSVPLIFFSSVSCRQWPEHLSLWLSNWNNRWQIRAVFGLKDSFYIVDKVYMQRELTAVLMILMCM